MATPRYLRFAQALALCSGLATVPACTGTTTMTTDTGPVGTDAPAVADAPSGVDAPSGTDAPATPTDAPSGSDVMATDDAPVITDDTGMLADAGDVDGGDICATCMCVGPLPFDAGEGALPDCWTVPGAEICCAVIGPLSPPNLPA